MALLEDVTFRAARDSCRALRDAEQKICFEIFLRVSPTGPESPDLGRLEFYLVIRQNPDNLFNVCAPAQMNKLVFNYFLAPLGHGRLKP